MSRGMFYKGVALGAAVSITMLSAQAAFAGTGVGGIFNLGRSNSVNSTSTLTGSTSGAQLAVTNKSTSASATGLTITTSTSRSPFKVNSKVVVANLNANYLQGKQVSDFLAATGIAADASKLGGKPASDYLTTTGTAADSAKLGGVPAADYARGCPLLTGVGENVGYQTWTGAQVGGAVAARAEITSPSGTLSSTGVIAAWTCSGGPVWVERAGTGVYCVVLDPTVPYLDPDSGLTYYGLPHSPGRVAVSALASSEFRTAVAAGWGPCGGTTGIPGQPQYFGYTVWTYDVSTGALADSSFVIMAV